MSPRPGPRRRPISVRASAAGHEAIENRAKAEADGNVSEMSRRLLAYAIGRMPKNWTPEAERQER